MKKLREKQQEKLELQKGLTDTVMEEARKRLLKRQQRLDVLKAKRQTVIGSLMPVAEEPEEDEEGGGGEDTHVPLAVRNLGRGASSNTPRSIISLSSIGDDESDSSSNVSSYDFADFAETMAKSIRAKVYGDDNSSDGSDGRHRDAVHAAHDMATALQNRFGKIQVGPPNDLGNLDDQRGMLDQPSTANDSLGAVSLSMTLSAAALGKSEVPANSIDKKVPTGPEMGRPKTSRGGSVPSSMMGSVSSEPNVADSPPTKLDRAPTRLIASKSESRAGNSSSDEDDNVSVTSKTSKSSERQSASISRDESAGKQHDIANKSKDGADSHGEISPQKSLVSLDSKGGSGSVTSKLSKQESFVYRKFEITKIQDHNTKASLLGSSRILPATEGPDGEPMLPNPLASSTPNQPGIVMVKHSFRDSESQELAPVLQDKVPSEVFRTNISDEPPRDADDDDDAVSVISSTMSEDSMSFGGAVYAGGIAKELKRRQPRGQTEGDVKQSLSSSDFGSVTEENTEKKKKKKKKRKDKLDDALADTTIDDKPLVGVPVKGEEGTAASSESKKKRKELLNEAVPEKTLHDHTRGINVQKPYAKGFSSKKTLDPLPPPSSVKASTAPSAAGDERKEYQSAFMKFLNPLFRKTHKNV